MSLQWPTTNKKMMLKLNKRRNITVEGCWIWVGPANNGYGRVVYKGVRWYAHRLAFYLYKPEEYNEFGMICHKCNNPRCFNPEHLYCGDASTNALDAVKAGTHFMASKTQCPKGHTYNDENTYVENGRRHCKICMKIYHSLEAVWS